MCGLELGAFFLIAVSPDITSLPESQCPYHGTVQDLKLEVTEFPQQ